jgi:hypothetical protein
LVRACLLLLPIIPLSFQGSKQRAPVLLPLLVDWCLVVLACCPIRGVSLKLPRKKIPSPANQMQILAR